MKYLVIEVQTLEDGTIANIVNSYDAINEAESKYHQILAYAAQSALPCHAAVMLQSDGMYLKSQAYKKNEAE